MQNLHFSFSPLTIKMLIASCLIISTHLYAQDYSCNQILSMADTYFEVGQRTQQGKVVPAITVDTLYLEDKAKMFLCQDGANWVVFANEQCVDPIVCLGDGSVRLTDLQESPLWLLLTEAMIGLDSLRISGNASNFIRSASMPTISRSRPTPLLDLNEVNVWNQAYNNSAYTDGNGNVIYSNHNNIYNRHSPAFYNCVDGRTWVGCTAVAMAQVMWYHKWPNSAYIPDTITNSGIPSSTTSLHSFTWINMPGAIYDSSPLYKVDALTYLLRDCAYACHMVYWPTGSSSTLTNAKSALTGTFNYNVKMRQYSSGAKKFNNTIKSEIASARPVIIQATHATDVINYGTHTFVIDGYDSSDEKFHINLGWGSGYNAWFSVSGTDCYANYTIARRMLYEIIPNRSASNSMSSDAELSSKVENNLIMVKAEDNVPIDWCIYDIYGNMMTSGTSPQADISCLPQGTYTFVAHTTSATCKIKFIK